jgi:hypothetical protein
MRSPNERALGDQASDARVPFRTGPGHCSDTFAITPIGDEVEVRGANGLLVGVPLYGRGGETLPQFAAQVTD